MKVKAKNVNAGTAFTCGITRYIATAVTAEAVYAKPTHVSIDGRWKPCAPDVCWEYLEPETEVTI